MKNAAATIASFVEVSRRQDSWPFMIYICAIAAVFAKLGDTRLPYESFHEHSYYSITISCFLGYFASNVPGILYDREAYKTDVDCSCVVLKCKERMLIVMSHLLGYTGAILAIVGVENHNVDAWILRICCFLHMTNQYALCRLLNYLRAPIFGNHEGFCIPLLLLNAVSVLSVIHIANTAVQATFVGVAMMYYVYAIIRFSRITFSESGDRIIVEGISTYCISFFVFMFALIGMEVGTSHVLFVFMIIDFLLSGTLMNSLNILARSFFSYASVEKNRLQSTLRYVSHEVRTPLNIVQLGVDELLEIASSDETRPINSVLEILKDCEVALVAGIGILNDTLNGEKCHIGANECNKVAVNLAAFIAASTRVFNLKAKMRKVELDLTGCHDPDVSCINANVDPGMMAVVLRNFISNALKFTPVGGKIFISISKEYISDDDDDDDGMDEGFCPGLLKPRSVRAVQDGNEGDHSNSISHDLTSPLSTNNPQWNYIGIKVKDTGVGMEKEDVDKMFTEVFQINPTELQGGQGSGFGLLVAGQVIALHHGKVKAFSEGIGKGMTISLYIPRFERPQDCHYCDVASDRPEFCNNDNHHSNDPMSSSIKQLTKESRVVSEGGSKENSLILSASPTPSNKVQPLASAEESCEGLTENAVLIIDDDPISSKFVEKIMTKVGIRCEKCTDGKAGFDKIIGEGNIYSLVLVDNMMPIMSGPECVSAVRKHGYTGRIVGLTGLTSDEDVKLFMESGANSVMSKPMNEKMLRATLIG